MIYYTSSMRVTSTSMMDEDQELLHLGYGDEVDGYDRQDQELYWLATGTVGIPYV